MIKARHKRFWIWFIRSYIAINRRLCFRAVEIKGDTLVPAGKPVLIIANHFSWWDGFFLFLLNDRKLKRKFHIMMLEEQLKTRMFLNKVGAYSVNRSSRSLLQSLRYTSHLLSEVNNLVVLFPQGEIESQHKRELKFARGVDTILGQCAEKPAIIFTAAVTDWFSSKKPSVNIYMRDYHYNGDETYRRIESDYNSFFQECRNQQIPEK
jgi:1-acyl-sn-glycerol-3-phosphate acyltransferase